VRGTAWLFCFGETWRWRRRDAATALARAAERRTCGACSSSGPSVFLHHCGVRRRCLRGSCSDLSARGRRTCGAGAALRTSLWFFLYACIASGCVPSAVRGLAATHLLARCCTTLHRRKAPVCWNRRQAFWDAAHPLPLCTAAGRRTYARHRSPRHSCHRAFALVNGLWRRGDETCSCRAPLVGGGGGRAAGALAGTKGCAGETLALPRCAHALPACCLLPARCCCCGGSGEERRRITTPRLKAAAATRAARGGAGVARASAVARACKSGRVAGAAHSSPETWRICACLPLELAAIATFSWRALLFAAAPVPPLPLPLLPCCIYIAPV